MKIRLIVTVLCFGAVSALAQWQPTNGLFSGEIHAVYKSDSTLFAGTSVIYKSSDNGKTWFVSNNGVSGSIYYVRCITKSGSRLIAGTTEGVYTSTDNGENWTISPGSSSLNVYMIVAKGTTLFLSGENGAVYKSTNDGVSWTAANSGINSSTSVRAIAVKGNDIYAGSGGYGIYKSSNDGASWTTVNNGLPGSYYTTNSFAVIGNNIIVGTGGAGIYKSTNDGASWSAINNGVSSSDYILAMTLNGSTAYASTINGSLLKSSDYTNWTAVFPGNQEVTRFEAFHSAPDGFYVGCYGYGSSEKSYGVFKTLDDGDTWTHIGVTEKPVSAIEISGNNIIAGTYDVTGNSFRNALFKTTETDSIWAYSLGGFSGSNITAIKASGTTVYLFDYEGPGNSQVYRSTNSGSNWTSTGYAVLYNKFVDFAIAGSIVYAADNDVHVSSDNGATWSVINTGLNNNNYVYALALKGSYIFAATDNGIFRNTVGGNNWTAVSTGLTSMIIKSLIVSGSTVYCGTQGAGIFKSDNDGASWAEANTGIPLYSNITCFTSSGTTIFAGTDGGVFASHDDGANWASINAGLADSSITSLKASTNYLWAGTNFNGVWRRDISEIVTGINPVEMRNEFRVFPNPASNATTVEIPDFQANKKYTIQLYNSIGASEMSFTAESRLVEFNIADLSRGIYFIRILSDDNVWSAPLMKE
ncbi:MAG: T9SS type A sorting domain-containing protein [Bacteroidetes bacterium]|nr:T9SS type A sorting domain-containing protein [Bacteroidota bacterium]MBU1717564.1 T9SS type A sorting domain-containing protein [Bacteroidota bacterium]